MMNRKKLSPISQSFVENESFLKRFLSRFMSQPTDIDDIVQETYLKAFEAEMAGEITHHKAYLFRIAKNTAMATLTRKAQFIIEYIEELGTPALLDHAASVEDQVASRQRLAVFCQAAESLPPVCRRVFLMRKVFGLSHAEISKRMDISTSTVEKHIAKGLQRCSQLMSAQDLLASGGQEITMNATDNQLQKRG